MKLRLLAAVISASVIISLLLFLKGATLFGNSDLDAACSELVDSIGPVRPTEGRLTWEFDYAPYQRNRFQPRYSKAAANAARRIRNAIEGKSSVQSLSIKAILSLLDGEPNKAVSLLEKALVMEPSNPSLLSDISAAYIERYEKSGDALDLIRAFSAADRATTAAPLLREARFNRALSLDYMNLSVLSRREWNKLLDIEKEGAWANEAQRRITRLVMLTSRPRWKDQKKKLEAYILSKEREHVWRLLSSFHRAARLYIEEEILVKWATAYLDGHSAKSDQYLAIAREVSTYLASSTGDTFLLDSVLVIDKADSVLARLLATGHIEYQNGKGLNSKVDYRAAEGHLTRASNLLRKAKSPFVLKADLARGISLHFQARYQEALMLLEKTYKSSRRRKYHVLTAEIMWMEGLVRVGIGQPSEAIKKYNFALTIFDSIGEIDNSAAVRQLLVETLDYQGDFSLAWEHCLKALGQADRIEDPLRRYQMFAIAGIAAFRRNEVRLARYFQEEAVLNARQLGNDSALSAALVWRSRYQQHLGQVKEALKDLEEAYLVSLQIPTIAAQERALADIFLAEAETKINRDTRSALKAATAAIGLYKRIGPSYELQKSYLARAHVYRRMHKFELAALDLDSAIRSIEEWRCGTQDTAQRVSFLDVERGAFDLMALTQLAMKRQESAFAYIERGRARTLLESISGRSLGGANGCTSLAKPLLVRELARKIPPHVVLIEYAILDGQLHAWIVKREAVRAVALSSDSKALEELVEELTKNLEVGRNIGQSIEVLESLYERIVLPLRDYIQDQKVIVFVMQGALERIPVSALRNPQTKKYIIEDYVVALAPSAEIYVESLRRAKSRQAPLRSNALVISDPAIDLARFPSLPRLQNAGWEAEAVAALYSNTVLISGVEATKMAFIREATKARLIHFAGHALIDTNAPWKSSLIFSPEDGSADLLDAAEVSKLNLPETELVVLSACGTTVGRTSKSEGAFSLAKAFMAAGVPVVIGTLWSTNDSSSAFTLLKIFHERLRAGHDPASAMRFAQRRMLEASSNTRDNDLGWGAFVVIGGVEGKSKVSEE